MGAALSTRGRTIPVPKSESGKQLRAFARIGAVGIELALSTVIGLLAGGWLDRKLSTTPYLSVVGLIMGVIAGFRSLIRTARKQSQSSSDRHD